MLFFLIDSLYLDGLPILYSHLIGFCPISDVFRKRGLILGEVYACNTLSG